MWGRMIEVFAIYGAITLTFVLMIQFSTHTKTIRDEFHTFLTGWTLITFVPGLIYILTGFVIRY